LGGGGGGGRGGPHAQFSCNITGPWLRNFASTLSEGDASGTWVRFMPLIALSQTFEASTPAPDLHSNPYPIENSTQCQGGNEGYGAGRVIGDPGMTGKTVDATAPPPEALALGKKAGLVP
jgi:hypothetical protein